MKTERAEQTLRARAPAFPVSSGLAHAELETDMVRGFRPRFCTRR